MLALAVDNYVGLPTSGRECPQFSLDPEKNHLGDIAEVKTDTTTVRPTVLSDLVPDEICLIGEAPFLQQMKAFRQKGVGTPKINVAGRLRQIANG